MIEAQLPDGTILEFPDGTQDAVVDRTVRRHLGIAPQRKVPMFDPEGGGYDHETARAAGIKPDEAGHWPSLDPRTGMLLKGRFHPTINETLREEERLGNKLIRKNGRYYSVPGKKEVPGVAESLKWTLGAPLGFAAAYTEPEKALDRNLRALGVGLGFLNVPNAAFWGGMNALAQNQPVLAGTLRSAVDSLTKKGEWGVTPDDNVKLITGKSILETFDAMLDIPADKAARQNISLARRALAGSGAMTVEFLMSAAFDFGPIFSSLRHIQRGIKSSWLAAATRAELKELMEKRPVLINLLNKIKQNRELKEAREGIRSKLQRQAALEAQARYRYTGPMRPRPAEFGKPERFREISEAAWVSKEKTEWAQQLAREGVDKWLGGKQTLEYMNEVRRRHGLPEYHVTPQGAVASKWTPDPVKVTTLAEAEMQMKEEAIQQAMRDFAEATEAIEAEKTLPMDALRYHLKQKLPEGDPSFTADFMGLQTMYERLAKTFGKKGDFDQAEDVALLFEDIFRERYGGLFKRDIRHLLKEEAELQGFSLRHSKKTGKWILTKAKKSTAYTDPDGVARGLGLADTAKEWQDLMYEAELGSQVTEAAQDFVHWAFPQGIEGLTWKQVAKTAEKLRKKLTTGRDPRTKFYDDWFYTVHRGLGKVPSGKVFVNKLQNLKDEFERNFSKGYIEIKDQLEFYGRRGDTEDVRLALDGYVDLVDKNAQNAAKGMRPTIDGIYKRADEVGIPELKEYRKDYFPHVILEAEELKEGTKREAVLSGAVREGRFKSREAAERALNGYIARCEGNTTDMRFIEWLAQDQDIPLSQALNLWERVIAPRKHPITGHLTKARAHRGNPWYERDLVEAVGRYMLRTERDIALFKYFGKDYEGAYRLIDRIDAEGGKRQLAEDLFNRVARPASFRHLGTWGRRALGFNAFKLNPLTSAINMTQTLAIPLRTSGHAFLKGLKSFSREEAERAGAVTNLTKRDFLKMAGGVGRSSDWYLRHIGFTWTEGILRTMAGNTGKQYAMDLTNILCGRKMSSTFRKWLRKATGQLEDPVKYARRQLTELGLDPNAIAKRGRMTGDELDQVQQRIARSTQFRGDEFDVPLKWLGPEGRVLAQFKTFIYNQARLLHKGVLKEARHGNFRPLMFYMTAYPAVGAGWDIAVNEALLGKEPPTGDNIFLKRYFRDLVAVGALGMYETLLSSMYYGTRSTYEALGGPSAGEAVDALHGGLEMVFGRKDPVDLMLKAVGSRAPFAGRIIRSRMSENKRRFSGVRGPRKAHRGR